MTVPTLTIRLRLENDQEHNTWFSNAARDGDPDFQVHVSREIWLTLGKPTEITVVVETFNEH